MHENRDGNDRNRTNRSGFTPRKRRGLGGRGTDYLAALALLLLRGVPPGGIVGGAAGRGGGGPAPLHVRVPDEERSRNPSERNQQKKKRRKRGGDKKRRLFARWGRGEEHEPCGVHGGSQWAGAAAGAGRKPRWVGRGRGGGLPRERKEDVKDQREREN